MYFHIYVPSFRAECAAFVLRVAGSSATSLPLLSNYTASFVTTLIIKVKTVLPRGRPGRHKDRVPIFGLDGRGACAFVVCTVLTKILKDGSSVGIAGWEA